MSVPAQNTCFGRTGVLLLGLSLLVLSVGCSADDAESAGGVDGTTQDTNGVDTASSADAASDDSDEAGEDVAGDVGEEGDAGTDIEPGDVADVEPVDVPDIAGDAIDATTGDTGEDVSEVVEPQTVALVDMFAFVKTPGLDDPWFGDGVKATEEACEPEDWFGETTPDGDQFDVRTDFCGYLTVHQELPIAVPEGATISIGVQHFLITEGETPWTIAVGLGSPGEAVWSIEVSVPNTETAYAETIVTERDYAAGERVYFHVSNHGANVWALTTLSATF